MTSPQLPLDLDPPSFFCNPDDLTKDVQTYRDVMQLLAGVIVVPSHAVRSAKRRAPEQKATP